MVHLAQSAAERLEGGRGSSHLVHKLLHACLQPPHLKLDGDQLVGAHDWLCGVPPALLQHAPRGLLRAEVTQVLEQRQHTQTAITKTGLH